MKKEFFKRFGIRFRGFTLAEVLITLVIIGIVAAMTIPSLMVKLDKVVKTNQIKVFESKLQKGMDRMNLAGEIGPYYKTTEEFIKALSAHMKIVTICKAGELQNCLPYESIQVQGEAKPIKVNDLSNGRNFGLNVDDYKDMAGMVLADGTPMILSWNVNCPVSDSDSSSRGGSQFGDNPSISTTSCIKGIYDINGTKGPNLFTKDVLSYGGVALDKGDVFKGDLAWLNGARILKAGTYSYMRKSEICDDNAVSGNVSFSKDGNEIIQTATIANTPEAVALGIKSCYNDYDYWAGAVRECGGITKVPTMAQLATLANAVFKLSSNGNPPSVAAYTNTGSLTFQSDSDAAKVLAAAGIDTSKSFYLWSNEEMDAERACSRSFSVPDGATFSGCNYASNSNRGYFGGQYTSMICLGE